MYLSLEQGEYEYLPHDNARRDRNIRSGRFAKVAGANKNIHRIRRRQIWTVKAIRRSIWMS